MTLIWSGTATDVIPFDGQDLEVGYSIDPTDPIGTIAIRAVGSPQAVHLPNSTRANVVWEDIPGTSPVLEVRQDGHFQPTLILVRRQSG